MGRLLHVIQHATCEHREDKVSSNKLRPPAELSISIARTSNYMYTHFSFTTSHSIPHPRHLLGS